MEIKNLSKEELEQLTEQIRIELKSREEHAQLVHIVLDTDGYYDSRKHGGAYAAVITSESGKTKRDFIERTSIAYDSKHKYYKARFEADLPVGAKIEARLSDGSWKNESRSYYVVEENGLRDATRAEVLGI